MLFKDLKPGDTLLVLDKGDVNVVRATVTQTTPPHVSTQPGVLGMFVGITINDDKYGGEYELNQTGVSAYAKNNTLVLTTDVNNVLAELRGIKVQAEGIVNNLDKYKDNIRRCDKFLADLDPVFKEKQENEQRFTKLENGFNQLAEGQKALIESNRKLTELLTNMTGK